MVYHPVSPLEQVTRAGLEAVHRSCFWESVRSCETEHYSQSEELEWSNLKGDIVALVSISVVHCPEGKV